MSRRKVVQVHCDRCTRVELVPVDSAENEEPAFEGMFGGDHVVYQDLCSGCTDLIKNHWAAFAAKISKSSPIRKKTG
jgi:hypothetical protein